MDRERESLSVSHARSSEFSLGVLARRIAIAVEPAPFAAVRALSAAQRGAPPVEVVDHVRVRHRVARHHDCFTSRMLATAAPPMRTTRVQCHGVPCAGGLLHPVDDGDDGQGRTVNQMPSGGRTVIEIPSALGSVPAVRWSSCGPDHARELATLSSSPVAWHRGSAPDLDRGRTWTARGRCSASVVNDRRPTTPEASPLHHCLNSGQARRWPAGRLQQTGDAQVAAGAER